MKTNSVTYNQADELTKVVRNFLEKKSTFELDSDVPATRLKISITEAIFPTISKSKTIGRAPMKKKIMMYFQAMPYLFTLPKISGGRRKVG